MTGYRVTWEMDIDADTPEDAARQAWAYMRQRGSEATVFTVTAAGAGPVEVDLCELVPGCYHAPDEPCGPTCDGGVDEVPPTGAQLVQAARDGIAAVQEAHRHCLAAEHRVRREVRAFWAGAVGPEA